MLDDIREGLVDCVVVKDLSRFGRNYIESGRYIEKIFPMLGVRFIAVNDGYDSLDGQYIGAFAAYGYLKDPEDRNHLVVDGYAADVVRDIFLQVQSEMRRRAGRIVRQELSARMNFTGQCL